MRRIRRLAVVSSGSRRPIFGHLAPAGGSEESRTLAKMLGRGYSPGRSMPSNIHVSRALTASLLALMAIGATACSRSEDDLREWRPTDHAQPPGAATAPSPAPGGARPSAPPPAAPGSPAQPHAGGLNPLTIRVWANNCARCHGQTGRGDGPDGRMLKVANLANPQWQASRSDAAIAEVIKTGRGAMPASGLPESTIHDLVKLIRMLAPRSAAPTQAPRAAEQPQRPGPTPPGPKAPAPPAAAPAAPGPTPSGGR